MPTSHSCKIPFLFSLLKAILDIQFKPGGTRTDLGMEMAGDLLFKGAGARPSVPHVLLVLTDGKTSINKSKKYPEVIKSLRVSCPYIPGFSL